MAGKIGIHSKMADSSPKINSFFLISSQRESAFIGYNIKSSRNSSCSLEVKNKDTNTTNMVALPLKSGNATYKLENLSPNSNYQITIHLSNKTDSIRSDSIDFKTKLIYQITLDKNNSNCSSCLTYGLDAVDTQLANPTSLGGWENKWPFNEMKLVALYDSQEIGHVKLTDKTKYDDGVTLHQNNDVFLRIPKIYYEFENGNTLKISNYKFSLTCDCFAHKQDGKEKDYIYIGSFLGATDNEGKLRSKVGMTPKTGFTIQQFIEAAKKCSSKYSITTFSSITLIQALFILAYKSLHSNYELGVGCTTNRPHNTGGSSSKGFVWGNRNWTTTEQILFLGLEDLWGNLYQFLTGCKIQNGIANIFNDEDESDKRTYSLNNALENFMKEAYWENDKGFLAKSTSGSSNTTYYTDKAEVNSPDGDLRVPIFGGFTTNDNGMFTTLLRYRNTLSGGDVGARLMMFGNDSTPSQYTKKIIIDLKGIELSKIPNNWNLVNGKLEYQFVPTGETLNINDLINIKALIPSGTRFNGLYFTGTKNEVNEIVLDNNDINIEVDNEQLFAFNIDLAEKTENSVKLNYQIDNPLASTIKQIAPSDTKTSISSDLIIEIRENFCDEITTTYENNTLKITSRIDHIMDGKLTISGTTQKDSLIIGSGTKGVIAFNNLRIKPSPNNSALIIENGADVEIKLSGTNELRHNESSTNTPTMIVEKGARVKFTYTDINSDSLSIRGEKRDQYVFIGRQYGWRPSIMEQVKNGNVSIKNRGRIIAEQQDIVFNVLGDSISGEKIINNTDGVITATKTNIPIASSNIILGNDINQELQESLSLSGKEGSDWVQNTDHYLIKSTCNEITIGGNTNKNIVIENRTNDLKINLNEININSKVEQGSTTSIIGKTIDNQDNVYKLEINILENTTNKLNIIQNSNIVINAANSKNCVLECWDISSTNNNGNIIINNGKIRSDLISIAQDESSDNINTLDNLKINGGLIEANFRNYGGGYVNNVSISNCIFSGTVPIPEYMTNNNKTIIDNCIIMDDSTHTPYSIEYASDNVVLMIPNKTYIDTDKNPYTKGIALMCYGHPSLETLDRIFKIEKNEIILENDMNNAILLYINKNSTLKITKSLEHPNDLIIGREMIYRNEIYNNGTIINSGNIVRLSIKNNGTVYNLGEISNDIQGTGKLIPLTITAELNGEPYSDITVDKINKTVVINNLATNTDYNINLIATIGNITEKSNVVNARLEEKINKYTINLNNLEYEDDAVGISTATNRSLGGWENKWPFNSIRFVGLKNGSVYKEIKKDDNTKYVDGSNVGTDVDVMVEIPKIYWSVVNNKLSISNKKIDSTYNCYAHLKDGVEKDFLYVAKYLGSTDPRGKLRSINNGTIIKNLSIQGFREKATLNGDGYRQFYYYLHKLLQILYVMLYKNYDSQTSIGTGKTISEVGSTNNKGLIYGVSDSSCGVSFLGIEDLWGNEFQYCDGVFIRDSAYGDYLLVEIDQTNNNFSSVGSGYTQIASLMKDPESEFLPFTGYIMEFNTYNNNSIFIPTQVHIGDNYNIICQDEAHINKNACIEVGGGETIGDRAGIFTINAFEDSAQSIDSFAGRLCYL